MALPFRIKEDWEEDSDVLLPELSPHAKVALMDAFMQGAEHPSAPPSPIFCDSDDDLPNLSPSPPLTPDCKQGAFVCADTEVCKPIMSAAIASACGALPEDSATGAADEGAAVATAAPPAAVSAAPPAAPTAEEAKEEVPTFDAHKVLPKPLQDVRDALHTSEKALARIPATFKEMVAKMPTCALRKRLEGKVLETNVDAELLVRASHFHFELMVGRSRATGQPAFQWMGSSSGLEASMGRVVAMEEAMTKGGGHGEGRILTLESLQPLALTDALCDAGAACMGIDASTLEGALGTGRAQLATYLDDWYQAKWLDVRSMRGMLQGRRWARWARKREVIVPLICGMMCTTDEVRRGTKGEVTVARGLADMDCWTVSDDVGGAEGEGAERDGLISLAQMLERLAQQDATAVAVLAQLRAEMNEARDTMRRIGETAPKDAAAEAEVAARHAQSMERAKRDVDAAETHVRKAAELHAKMQEARKRAVEKAAVAAKAAAAAGAKVPDTVDGVAQTHPGLITVNSRNDKHGGQVVAALLLTVSQQRDVALDAIQQRQHDDSSFDADAATADLMKRTIAPLLVPVAALANADMFSHVRELMAASIHEAPAVCLEMNVPHDVQRASEARGVTSDLTLAWPRQIVRP